MSKFKVGDLVYMNVAPDLRYRVAKVNGQYMKLERLEGNRNGPPGSFTDDDEKESDYSLSATKVHAPSPSPPSPKRVYIAGPMFSSGRLTKNLNDGITMYHLLISAGLAPYLPHFGVYADTLQPREEAEWLALDKVWLAQCQAMIRLPGVSKGADLEEQWCKELGIPVFYYLADLITWSKK